MKKLSKEEINVIVNEVNNKISKLENLECEKLLKDNDKYSEIVDLVYEINDLNDKVNELKEFINEKCNELRKDLNINLWCNNNNYEGFKLGFNLVKDRSSYRNYNEIYNKLVLMNINNNINVEELIDNLVKEYKN